MVLRVLHLPCGQWKIEGSARCAWQAVPWSSVCPELRGAGCAPAPGDVGSPGTLTDLNSVIYGFVLLLSPQLLSVSLQPQCCPLRLKPSAAVLFREAPHCCLQPGDSSELSGRTEPEKGV